MPFDPNSAKKAGKKSKRGPAKKEGIKKTVAWYLENQEWLEKIISRKY